MEITVQSMKRCELVTVAGRIDSANAPEFEEALLGLVDAGKRNLVVNVAALEYISSAGLNHLIATEIKVRRKTPAGKVVLSQVSSELHEILDLVGFTRVFEIYDSDTAAVGSF